LVLLIATGSIVSIASNQVSQEHKVIAGAIFKFIKFVEWDGHLTEPKQNFYMCLQKHDVAFEPFTKRKVQGKAIKLLLISENKTEELCDALYLNSAKTDMTQVLERYKNQAILTIAENADFIEQGGIMQLGRRNNRLTFSINQRAAKANHLTIGFQLLSLAQHVIES